MDNDPQMQQILEQLEHLTVAVEELRTYTGLIPAGGVEPDGTTLESTIEERAVTLADETETIRAELARETVAWRLKLAQKMDLQRHDERILAILGAIALLIVVGIAIF